MEGRTVAGIALPEGDPGAVEAAGHALRRVSGGFDRTAATVQAAVHAVPGWFGLASMNFQNACMNYRAAAGLADGACADVARELAAYAKELETARHRVERMQEQAQRHEETERDALRNVDTARGRLRSAYNALKMSVADTALDGGASQQAAQSEIDAANEDMRREGERATRARDAIDGLKADALEVRQHVEQRGRQAAARVSAAGDQLPTVPGAPSGTVGGTPVSANTHTFGGWVRVVVVQVGGSTAVVKEHTADGKWKVTVIEGWEGGATVGPPSAGVDGKKGRLGFGGEAESSYLAGFKKASVYEFKSEEEADRFIFYEPRKVNDDAYQNMYPNEYVSDSQLAQHQKAKEFDRWQERQKPVETYTEGGGRVHIDYGFDPAGGASAEREAVIGTKHDTKTGTETQYLKVGGNLEGHIATGPIQSGGGAQGEVVGSITRDPQGNMKTFSVTVSGEAHGTAGADKVASHSEESGVRHERQMTLDLNDPVNKRIVEQYVNSGGTDAAAAAQLGDRLTTHARVDERTFTTGKSTSGAHFDAKAAGVGGSMSDQEQSLTSMHHRGAGSGQDVQTVGS